jgi:hypothetical protein
MAATSQPASDSSRELLRHTLATLAYRAGKTLRDAPESFATFSTGEKGRTPAHILAHMGDLFDWALSIAQGKQAWHDSEPLRWPDEVSDFSKRWRPLTAIWLQTLRSLLRRGSYFRVQLQTR